MVNATREYLPTVNDKTRFMMLSKGGKVHVVNDKRTDLKTEANGGSRCMTVRKFHVAGKIKPRSKDKGLSADAALAIGGCAACRTEVVAGKQVPKRTKEDRAAKRDEVLDRARPKSAKKAKDQNRAVDEAVKKERRKADKAVLNRGSNPTKTKAGTRSVGGTSEDKAEDLARFIRDQGWKAEVTTSDPNQATVTAKHGDKVVACNFIDGKYDITNQATITVGSWTGTLRGAHAVRRQIDGSLDDRDRPHPVPGKGRGGPRTRKADDEVPEEESPEDAKRRVPFLTDDDDATILDAVMGHRIRWRNGVSKSVEEAVVPPEVGKGKRPWVSISVHPKSGRRILDFFVFEGMADGDPVFGPERAVALDKIIRVLEG